MKPTNPRQFLLFLWESPTLMTWGSFLTRSLSAVVILPLVLRNFQQAEITLWLMFAQIISLQILVDMGFTPTFARQIAYAKAAQNWQLVSQIRKIMGIVYARMTLISFGILLTIGTYFVYEPINKLGENHLNGWLAWAMIVLTSLFYLRGNLYSAYLQGLNQVATLRRWEVLISTGGIISSFVVLLLDGGVLGIVVASQVWVLMGILLNRWLVSKIEGSRQSLKPEEKMEGSRQSLKPEEKMEGSRQSLKPEEKMEGSRQSLKPEGEVVVSEDTDNSDSSRQSLEPEEKIVSGDTDNGEKSDENAIFQTIWQTAWRSGVGVLVSFGSLRFASLYMGREMVSTQAAIFLFGLRIIEMINEFAQAPIYSKLPRLASLYAERNMGVMVGIAKQGMARSHLIFVGAFILVGLFGDFALKFIGSKTQFPDTLLWLGLGVAYFFQRFGAMHLHFFSTTNQIIWHKVNSVASTIFIITFLVVFYHFNPLYSYPIALIISSLLFYSWYCAYRSYKEFGLHFWQFEKDVSLLPLLALLAYAIIWGVRGGIFGH